MTSMDVDSYTPNNSRMDSSHREPADFTDDNLHPATIDQKYLRKKLRSGQSMAQPSDLFECLDVPKHNYFPSETMKKIRGTNKTSTPSIPSNPIS